MNKSLFSIFALLLFYCSFILACKKNTKSSVAQNKIIQVSVESSLKPVMEEIIEVFSYQYPNHKIKITYKAQDFCQKDLSNPSVDLVIDCSALNEKEKEKYYQQNHFYFITNILAFDAILIISNKTTPVNKITLKEIPLLLTKRIHKEQTLIVDGLSATGTYQYLSNKFLGGKNFFQHIEGAENSEELLNHIAKHPNNIGFISNLWLSQLSLDKAIVVASVKNTNKKEYTEPTKENILSNQYALIRPIVFVLKHNYETPATWLVSFMQQEKGQLIFKRNGAIPANMNLSVRRVKI